MGKSGSGVTAGVTARLIHETETTFYRAGGLTFRRVGGTPKLFGRIQLDVDLARKVIALVLGYSEDIRIRVDSRRSLAEIVAAGNFDIVDPTILDDVFLPEGTDVKDENPVKDETIVLFPFDAEHDTVWLEREMRRSRFRHARIKELLALGAAKPLLQTEHRIVALGSVSKQLLTSECNGDFIRCVPVIDLFQDKRRVIAEPCRSKWEDEFRFAAVRM